MAVNNRVKELAQHVHAIGRCYIESNLADDVAKELEKYPGVFALGESQNGYTLIGRCD